MAATSTYSTVACVVFFGLKRADSLSRRSSGTLAMPTCASRECRACASSFAFVRIRNSEVLPTCGNPMIPVFMTPYDLLFITLLSPLASNPDVLAGSHPFARSREVGRLMTGTQRPSGVSQSPVRSSRTSAGLLEIAGDVHNEVDGAV